MMLQLQRYTLNVRYVPGKLMYVADTLSRAYITGDAECGAPEDMEVLVHSLVENLAATIHKLEQYRRVFANDGSNAEVEALYPTRVATAEIGGLPRDSSVLGYTRRAS